MTLRLSIENMDRLPDGGPLRVEVKGRGLDIGRDAHLDWTLPDPSRTSRASIARSVFATAAIGCTTSRPTARSSTARSFGSTRPIGCATAIGWHRPLYHRRRGRGTGAGAAARLGVGAAARRRSPTCGARSARPRRRTTATPIGPEARGARPAISSISLRGRARESLRPRRGARPAATPGSAPRRAGAAAREPAAPDHAPRRAAAASAAARSGEPRAAAPQARAAAPPPPRSSRAPPPTRASRRIAAPPAFPSARSPAAIRTRRRRDRRRAAADRAKSRADAVSAPRPSP